MKTKTLLLLCILPLFVLAQETQNQSAGTSNPAQIYHINFHFAGFSDLVFLTVSSEDAFYADYIPSNPMPLDLPEGYYNLVAHCNTSHAVYAVLDRFHVYKNMDTTIQQTSANHLVLLNMTDENGALIPDPGKHKANQTDIYFDFGPEYKLPVRTFNFPDWWQDSVYLSDIPSSIKVRIDRTTAVKKAQYHYYYVTYPTLTSLSGDTVLNNPASGLLTFPQVFRNDPAQTYYYGWGHGFIRNTRMGGFFPNFVIATLDTKSPTKRVDTVMFHAMPASGDSVLAWAAVSIFHIKGSISKDDIIYSPYSFVNEDQTLVLSENGYPLCTADYRVQPGEFSYYGSTVPFNFLSSENPPSSNILKFSTYFRGYYNEIRNNDLSKTTMQIRQNNQSIYYDTLNGSYFYSGLPSAAPCTVIFNDSNYTLYGKQGWLKSTLSINLSDPEDADPPTPVSFKVLQGDVITTEVVRGFPASVSFTAGDYFTIDMQRFYKPLQSAGLFYKSYTDDHWEPLEVTADLANFDSLSGMPYLADLSQLTSLPSDSVWVDLRLELTDPYGNAMIQEIHPAFLLRDVITGTQNHDLSAGNIYPNPTGKYLFFSNSFKNDQYRICDLQGKELLTGNCSGSADLSTLIPGIYIVRIFSSNGTVVSVEKVIRY